MGEGRCGGETLALPTPPLLVISDRQSCGGDVAAVLEAAFRGGARWAMVREKDLAHDDLVALARRVVAAARPFAATVVVNGDAAAAREAGAAGVHLPQGLSVAAARAVLGAAALVGVSAHSLAEAEAAESAGADYATIGPVFPTESKPGYGPALGLGGLGRIAGAVRLPLLALGGVSPDNAALCRAAGAAGVAVMGGIMRARDPAAAATAFAVALA